MLNLSSVNDTKDIATKEYVDGKTVVTGVKGNSESSYRTGNVNLTAANVGAIAKNAECLTTNPFRTPTFDGIYISKIDNGLYAADKRWNVTYTGTSVSGSVANLFDGNYESRLQITKSTTGVVLVNFANTTYFPGYPYGYILVSFYYNEQPENVSGRVYCNHSSQGVGWKTISFTRVSDSTTTACVYRSEHQGYYNISQMEITVVAGSSSVAGVNQIEIHLDRPHPSYTPFVSKYAAETLYYNITAPKFIGALQGNADTATNATKVNNHTVNADVPSGAKFTDTTYDPLTASEANTGTSTTARTISAKVLADYVASHGGDTPFPLEITDPDIDLSTTPSTARFDQTLRGLDANGDIIWAVDSVHDTSGAHGFQLNSFGGGNQNSLQMLMKPDGTASMWISQPAVWRNALGAAASSHNHAASNITSGVLATARGGVPTGGTTGQVLAKTGDSDNAVDWVTPSGGSGGGSQIDLLWTNPNPTSNFAAQTLSGIPWQDYRFLFIDHYTAGNGNIAAHYETSVISTDNPSDWSWITCIREVPFGRGVKFPASNQVQFGSQTYYSTYNGADATIFDDWPFIVPTKIWGVKQGGSSGTATDVLYDNDSGTTGTVTLSKSAANYDHMRIYFRYIDDDFYGSVDVYSPNGKTVQLTIAETTSWHGWLLGRAVVISGTSITTHNGNNYGEGRVDGDAAWSNTNNIGITRVEAWNGTYTSATEVTCTLDTTYASTSRSTVKCSKNGGVCTITFMPLVLKAQSGRNTFGTVPEGFRPVGGEYYIHPNGWSSENYLIVGTDGTLKAHVNLPSENESYASGTYVIGG